MDREKTYNCPECDTKTYKWRPKMEYETNYKEFGPVTIYACGWQCTECGHQGFTEDDPDPYELVKRLHRPAVYDDGSEKI